MALSRAPIGCPVSPGLQPLQMPWVTAIRALSCPPLDDSRAPPPHTDTEAEAARPTAAWSRGGQGGGSWGRSLTIDVVPGQVLEGLIKQDDRQRNLEHHHPLAPTQWGHLENELWGRSG